jgi:hypothetical protein
LSRIGATAAPGEDQHAEQQAEANGWINQAVGGFRHANHH